MIALIADGPAVAPHDAAGFLQLSVRPQHLGADGADRGIGLQPAQRVCNGAFCQFHVVVEIQHRIGCRNFQPGVATADKADIAFEPQQTGAGDVLCQVARFVRGTGVNQNQLDGPWVVRAQRCQCLKR